MMRMDVGLLSQGSFCSLPEKLYLLLVLDVVDIIKASEMLVATRISEYFLKSLKF